MRGPDNAAGDSDYTFANVGDGEVWYYELELSMPLTVIGLENTGVYANYKPLSKSVFSKIDWSSTTVLQ